MSSGRNKISATDGVDMGRLGSDAALLRSVLEVHAQLNLTEQLACLLESTAAWCGAEAAFALGPGGEAGTLALLASTVGKNDPRLPILGRVDAEEIRTWLADGPEDFEGLGPLGKLADPWPGRPPAAGYAVPIRDAAGAAVAALLMLFAEAPPGKALERTGQLVGLTRQAVLNALQVAAMRELVIKDDTAHCFNRRYFESSLPDELSRANRFHAPLSLIFLDMDNLKQVNKRYGHAMGSQTLREVSDRVRAKIRRFDKLFRFGGDEFCIVLPETEWHGALEVAERVREAIASKPFLVRSVGDGNGTRMTASLGIAAFPLHARTQADLIEQADRAMQRIKNGTKNSIGIAEIVGESHGS